MDSSREGCSQDAYNQFDDHADPRWESSKPDDIQERKLLELYPTYVQPKYLTKEWLYANDLNILSCHRWDPVKLKPEIRVVEFGSGFPLHDSHLYDIASRPEEVRSGLQSVRFWCNKADVSNEALIALAKACPGIQHISIRRAPTISDAALSAILHNCLGLISLELGVPREISAPLKIETLEQVGKENLCQNLRFLALNFYELPIIETTDCFERLSGERRNEDPSKSLEIVSRRSVGVFYWREGSSHWTVESDEDNSLDRDVNFGRPENDPDHPTEEHDTDNLDNPEDDEMDVDDDLNDSDDDDEIDSDDDPDDDSDASKDHDIDENDDFDESDHSEDSDSGSGSENEFEAESGDTLESLGCHEAARIIENGAVHEEDEHQKFSEAEGEESQYQKNSRYLQAIFDYDMMWDKSTPVPTTYRAPTYKPAERVCFNTEKRFDASKLKDGVLQVVFGPKFNVKDLHLTAISRAPCRFRLESIQIGEINRDRAIRITNDAVLSLVRACCQLRDVRFDSCEKLKDEALLAICRHCPEIRNISISGLDSNYEGRINGRKSLKALEKDPDLARNLKKLSLLEQQDIDVDLLRNLSRKRKEDFEIIEGSMSIGNTTTWCGGTKLYMEWEDGEPGYFEYDSA